MTDEHRARLHECPTCGACPSQPCWTLSASAILPTSHRARYRAAGLALPTPAQAIRQRERKEARVIELAEWWERRRAQKGSA